MKAFFQRGAKRENGIGKIGIRKRTMRNGRPSLANFLHIIGRQEIGMRKHGSAPEQSETIEHFRVGGTIAGQGIAMGPVAFGAMGLNVASAFPGDRPKSLQRRVGAGGYEA